MGSDNKYLVFQAPVLVLLHVPPLVEIAAVCPGEGGGCRVGHHHFCADTLKRGRLQPEAVGGPGRSYGSLSGTGNSRRP